MFRFTQRTVVPENVCEKCQKTCDVNGNQQQIDAFLDMDPSNKWKPSTVTVSADLSPCEPFGNNNNNNSTNNNNNNTKNNYNDNTNNNYIGDDDDDDDEDDDDEDGLEPERPYLTLTSSPLKQRRHLHQYQQQEQQQQQQHRQPRFSSTSSLDRIGANRERSTDSLDRVEFCSTTDYR